MTLRTNLVILGALLCAQATQGALFVPTDLAPGSKYHLTFLTDSKRSAISDLIDDYDAFVMADVENIAELKDLEWKAIATANDLEGNLVEAATHVAVKGPVYRLDGTLVATNSSDLFNGSIAAPINMTPSGTKNIDANVWTGSGSNGKLVKCKDTGGGPWDCYLGFADPDVQTMGGISSGIDKTWITGNEMSWSRQNQMYAISEELIVPNNAIPGDLDGNGVVDANDINQLGAAIRANSTDTKFDLNKSGAVEKTDANYMLDTILKVWLGDSNLDGNFNTGDLVTVFSVGEYEDLTVGNSTWAEGDWNLDGDFNTGDLVAAFSQGGYEVGPRSAVSAVPEPTSGLGLAFGAMLLGFVRRRFGRSI